MDATPEREETVGDFEGRLLEIARSYESYGMLNEKRSVPPHQALLHGFFQPQQDLPGLLETRHKVKASTSPDSSPHGKKLYYLFVKEDCTPTADSKQRVGQVIVNEAWEPEAVGAIEQLRGTGWIQRKLKY